MKLVREWVMSLFGGRMFFLWKTEVMASRNSLRRVCTQVLLRSRKEGKTEARERESTDGVEGGRSMVTWNLVLQKF